jgi:hypothetical protein
MRADSSDAMVGGGGGAQLGARGGAKKRIKGKDWRLLEALTFSFSIKKKKRLRHTRFFC